MITVYIDESGTLPDPKDQVVVLAAATSSELLVFRRALKKVRGKLSRQNRKLSELKFYLAGDRTRSKYLRLLSKEDITVFVLIVEKGSQSIPDSPENYAVLSWLLLLDLQAYFGKNEIKIIFDRHFHKESDEQLLFKNLASLLGQKLSMASTDSVNEPGIAAADMVAGAFLAWRRGKTEVFSKLIKGKVVIEKIINWKEAKKRYLEALRTSRFT